ncbi:MAG: pantoate--beta-alanine ligase [Candidatus Schekmanbacteria bacterium]|nr:pantoate--beta-alanine ligase [Candidatus Schekmanbacteria bacterium]
MLVVEKIQQMKELSARWKKERKTIGLVPTMGCLHDGHLSLIRKSREDCDVTVVSIFVNPTQFGPKEDYTAYPRIFEQDCEDCMNEKVDVIFAPSVEEMYPEGFQTSVSVKLLQTHLCGLSRPGHFDGVATIVLKLFNIVFPHKAYFGEKDYQQLQIIKKMVNDLNLDTAIVAMPIVREPDCVAMSSRNKYLNPEDRGRAKILRKIIKEAEHLIINGEVEPEAVLSALHKIVKKEKNIVVDYILLCDPDTLEDLDTLEKNVLVAVAVKIGNTRLIDNMVIRR